MKILVFSDSHGNTANMAEALRREGPDRVLHLGDCVGDAAALMRQFPAVTVNCVRGNCDGCDAAPEALYPILEGHRTMMVHGHGYHVKSDYENVIWAAREAEAEILLFGHTHQSLCQRENGLWVMNPGSCRGWGPTTYGVILLEKGRILCYIQTM